MRLEPRANDGTAWLRYDIEHVTQKTGPQHYSVTMIATSRRFGGQRCWWVCPRTHKRVAKLYLPNGGDRFLSRSVYGYAIKASGKRPLAGCMIEAKTLCEVGRPLQRVVHYTMSGCCTAGSGHQGDLSRDTGLTTGRQEAGLRRAGGSFRTVVRHPRASERERMSRSASE
jgi:hypothetical protein